mmetsp:Transcript_57700/g.155667  ORF Transcript_57700/g.155667 Transcript_57700/m.155667 type:complete len:245 (+) Transcript_57700:876-1610(+)
MGRRSARGARCVAGPLVAGRRRRGRGRRRRRGQGGVGGDSRGHPGDHAERVHGGPVPAGGRGHPRHAEQRPGPLLPHPGQRGPRGGRHWQARGQRRRPAGAAGGRPVEAPADRRPPGPADQPRRVRGGRRRGGGRQRRGGQPLRARGRRRPAAAPARRRAAAGPAGGGGAGEALRLHVRPQAPGLPAQRRPSADAPQADKTEQTGQRCRGWAARARQMTRCRAPAGALRLEGGGPPPPWGEEGE